MKRRTRLCVIVFMERSGWLVHDLRDTYIKGLERIDAVLDTLDTLGVIWCLCVLE